MEAGWGGWTLGVIVFIHATATTEIYTRSRRDARPTSRLAGMLLFECAEDVLRLKLGAEGQQTPPAKGIDGPYMDHTSTIHLPYIDHR